jgi:hypothetical protein
VLGVVNLKHLWRKLTHSKKRAHAKNENNASSAYDTLPYYYPTEQVNNRDKLIKKKNVIDSTLQAK